MTLTGVGQVFLGGTYPVVLWTLTAVFGAMLAIVSPAAVAWSDAHLPSKLHTYPLSKGNSFIHALSTRTV